jgi:hypothetical protein
MRITSMVLCVFTLSATMAAAQAGEIQIDYYASFVPSGDGTPFSDYVASEVSPDLRFAQGCWWSWHPYGLNAFGAHMKGTLIVHETGSYPFALSSDDGSRVYLDGKLALDNGDAHGPTTVLTILKLSAGYHPFELNFWEDGTGASGVDFALPAGVTFGEATVPDVGALLQQLIEDVAGIGLGRSLTNKVTLAHSYYAMQDIGATCGVLTSFVNEVQAQQDKKIPGNAASGLIFDARTVMTAIGCQ